MIGFNELLSHEDIEPSRVKLVRHQDRRGDRTPYQLWSPDSTNTSEFELYQRIQSRPVFKGAQFIASFVATPLDETLFVGLYEIAGVGVVPSGQTDPLSGQDCGGKNFYDLALRTELSDYRGRLIIEWGQGYRSWVQLARNRPKEVLEIRRYFSEPPFPGFLNFKQNLGDLKKVPTVWRNHLSSVRGIYLLVHPDTGKQYVGSATGSDGFWGRWEQYVASGHGGNKRMQDIPAADYQVSVLEVASSTADEPAILELENRWKDKLKSRKFGLNGN